MNQKTGTKENARFKRADAEIKINIGDWGCVLFILTSRLHDEY